MNSASYVAEFHTVEEGTVLFRQKDPPACLYYIISGEVQVYEHPKNRSRPRTPEYRSRKKLSDIVSQLGDFLLSFKKGRKYMSPAQEDRLMQKIFERHPTYEGFSQVAEGSTLGNQMATLGPGNTFGELALRSEVPRTATVKCSQRCEFLRLHKKNFDVRLCDKVCYFKASVPGFKALKHTGDFQSHPARMFEDCHFKKGDVFLEEGVVGPPKIVVIRTGKVAINRNGRAKTGVFARKSSIRSQIRCQHTATSRTWLEMGAHQAFCSLGMLGLGNVEPYSAVVISEDCHCYVLTGDRSCDFEDMSP
jgi:CRP-like cAMP-binding protein